MEQELGREGRDRTVELFPGDSLAGVVLDDRRLVGPLLGVEGDIIGDVRQEGFIHPTAAFVLLVILHGGGLSVIGFLGDDAHGLSRIG